MHHSLHTSKKDYHISIKHTNLAGLFVIEWENNMFLHEIHVSQGLVSFEKERQ
jgi:hypothetical protein